MPRSSTQRIAYIDWLRGFACLVMFQTHCYDSWLGGAARQGKFLALSRLGGTLPAPLFLFLAGISFAMVTDKLRRKGTAPGEIAAITIKRGGEVFVIGLLFRVWSFLLGWKGSPWTDLLRVDVLNIIGLSLMLLGVACWIAAIGNSQNLGRVRMKSMAAGVTGFAAIALTTPLIWTTWRPHWRAWWLESYLNGVHTFDKPQSWLFPVFPWSAFAFIGLAAGFFLFSDWARKNEAALAGLIGLAGVALATMGYLLDARPERLYPIYDFWHTSPNFLLIRTGIVMLGLTAAYAWCRWGLGQRGFSPLIELGKSSLLVYWVHMEFVYGGLSILHKHGEGIARATAGVLAIFIGMTLLATFWNRFQGRWSEIPAFFRLPHGLRQD